MRKRGSSTVPRGDETIYLPCIGRILLDTVIVAGVVVYG